jgi:hypothetical protein
LQAGDLLVACIGSRNSNVITSVTLPSGWTLVDEQKSGNVTAGSTNGIASGVMAYIIRGASDPSFTFTHPSGLSVAQGTIAAYRPISPVTLDTSNSSTGSTNSTNATVLGFSTAASKDLLVYMAVGGQASTWSTFDATVDPTTASGTGGQTADPIAGTWQERMDLSTTTGADMSLAVADAVRATAGATGTFVATSSLAAANVGIVGAFKLLSTITGTVAANEASDTALINGTLGVFGTLNATEASDTALINATVRWDVTIAANEASDTALISGTTAWNVAIAAAEASDTALITATSTHGVVIAANEASDTALITGTRAWNVTIAATEASDTALITGTTRWNVAIAALEASDTADISGSVFTAGTIAGSVSANEAPDTALITGAVTGIAGILTATEAPDTALINGAVRWNVAISASEASDTALITGTTRWNATLAATEAPDTALITGTVTAAGAITGILAAIEASDIALITGNVPVPGPEPGPEPTPLPPSRPGVLKFGRRVTINRW